MGERFDSSRMTGPTNRPGQNVYGEFNAPGVGTDMSFRELLGTAEQGQVAATLPRERLREQQFAFDPTAQAAFGQGLKASTGLTGTESIAPDLAASRKNIFEEAARAGYEQAGARGFSDPGGTVAGRSIGRELGAAAAQAAAEDAQLRLQAQGQMLGARGEGAGQLAQLGGTAAGATRGTQALNLQGAEGLNQMGVTQRGQDVDLMRLGGQLGNQRLGGVADIYRAYTGAQLGAEGEATTRGMGLANLRQQADEALRRGDTDTYNALTQRIRTEGDIYGRGREADMQAALGGYGAQTGRMGTMGDIASRGRELGMGEFRAVTERGAGEEAARAEAARIGLNYDTLSANERAQLNQQMNQRYQTDTEARLGEERARAEAGRMGLDWDRLGAQERADLNQQVNQRYQTDVQRELGVGEQRLGAMTDFARIGQAGDIGREQNQIERQRVVGNLAQQVLAGGAAGQQAQTNLMYAAMAGDQNAYNAIIQLQVAGEWNLEGVSLQAGRGGSDIGGILSGIGALAQGAAATKGGG
jgi:hypothetical protein